MTYWTNVGKFWRGVRWLWTRRQVVTVVPKWDGSLKAGTIAAVEESRVVRGWDGPESDGIQYRTDWGPWRFLLVYLFDYGTRVHSGGAVVSWSRWWYERRKRLGHAGFMTRLLNHIQENHGARAGGPLWSTEDTAWAVAGGLVFWLLGVPAIVWGAVRLVRWVVS